MSDEEIEVVADYINLVLVDDDVFAKEDLGDIASDDVENGKKIYNEKGCKACHQIGMEGGAVGPNLSAVGDRLTSGYIYALKRSSEVGLFKRGAKLWFEG